MSQLVSQTVTYGLDGNAFSISTHGTNGVLRIMAGNPYASNTVPIIDINSDKSVHFYGQINADIDGVAERARQVAPAHSYEDGRSASPSSLTL